jgi:hypothetical protein
MRTRFWLKLLPGLLLALLAATAFAGGVVVTLDEELGAVTPNTPFDVDFTIRSAHDGSMQDGFTPFITAVNSETGESLTFDAIAQTDAGHYRATMTLPAGTWNWRIAPDRDYPDQLIAEMTPLEVTAAAAAPASRALAGVSVNWLWVVLPLVALLLSVLALASRRRAAISA